MATVHSVRLPRESVSYAALAEVDSDETAARQQCASVLALRRATRLTRAGEFRYWFGLAAVECLLIVYLGGVRLDAQNLAQCTALSAFTMATHYAVAASEGWIRFDTLISCKKQLLMMLTTRCQSGVVCIHVRKTKHRVRRAAAVHESGRQCTVERQCMEIQCMDLRSQYTEEEVDN